MSGSGVAFFDPDRTLLATNSARDWILRELRLGHMGRIEVARAAIWIGFYQLGFAQMEATIRKAVATLEGKSEEALRQRTRDFWLEDVVHQVRPGAQAVLDRHRSQGDLLVLLTSTSNYLSALASSALGLDDYLSNFLEVRGGCFTGTLREPLCFGVGKTVYARHYAEHRDIPLDRCAFYTDSFSDLPGLELVGQPVAVHPDPRLERVARRRGWAVELWGTPPPRASDPTMG